MTKQVIYISRTSCLAQHRQNMCIYGTHRLDIDISCFIDSRTNKHIIHMHVQCTIIKHNNILECSLIVTIHRINKSWNNKNHTPKISWNKMIHKAITGLVALPICKSFAATWSNSTECPQIWSWSMELWSYNPHMNRNTGINHTYKNDATFNQCLK